MTIAPPPLKHRLSNIQALRGIAALLVVFSHLLIIEQKYSPDQILGNWVELGILGVDLFFVISGFIMVNVAWSAPRGVRAWTEFLFARASRIYPLYWLVSLALLAIWLWKPDIVFSSLYGKPDIVKSFALWPDTRPPLLAIGWTLVHEVFFYLVLAFALLLKARWLLPFLAAWILALCTGITVDTASASPVLGILFHPMSFEFLAGAFAGYAFKKYGGVFGQAALGIGLLTCAAAIASTLLHHGGVPESYLLRAAYFSLPIALIVYGLAAIETRNLVLPACMSRLGDWSYSLYLTHVLSLSLLGRAWHMFAQKGSWDNGIAIFALPAFAIVIAAICWKFAENPMLNIAKTLRRRWFAPT